MPALGLGSVMVSPAGWGTIAAARSMPILGRGDSQALPKV
jgi:hypothetical protein